ncbi:multiple epidermal growth factor-like domains 10 [Elysia marginata]|uniref:Multiple epidermal growth factor-like domains 10 n=1 Tax=Elysia marginata TaxID=1093978 RepID=A0AAV4IN79_9GAST|nr:multiple epidermal growth factor-like domains 10 [Elysia marginata]
MYGADCKKPCSPLCKGAVKACDFVNGSCVFGCEDGYQGVLCDAACANNTYGANCSSKCSPNCRGRDKLCDHTNGLCLFGCENGNEGPLCNVSKAEAYNAIDQKGHVSTLAAILSSLAFAGVVLTVCLIPAFLLPKDEVGTTTTGENTQAPQMEQKEFPTQMSSGHYTFGEVYSMNELSYYYDDDASYYDDTAVQSNEFIY